VPAKIEDEYYVLDDKKRNLVEENYMFIHWKSKEWYNKLNGAIEYDDLVSIATIGFIKSLKYYDNNKSKITTFTGNLIDQHIRREAIRGIKKDDNEFSVDEELLISNENAIVINDVKNTQFLEDKIINNILISQLYDTYKHRFRETGRKTLYLYIFKQWTKAEISKELNISRERVGQHIRRFQELCRENVRKEDLIA